MFNRMSTLLILGAGYTATAIASRLRADGWTVLGTTRDPAKAEALADAGITPVALAESDPVGLLTGALEGTTHWLVGAAPGPDGDPFLARFGRVLAAAPSPAWIGYLSTTGVYGDVGGAWIDETAPLAATSDRGRNRIAAERAWSDLGAARGVPVALFRLAGIYGPGRSALDQVLGGRARRIVKPGHVFNRIHVEDIADAVAAAARGRIGGAFNLADDEPAESAAVLAYAADLLGRPPPPALPYDPDALSPMARSFYAELKRIDNAKAKRELGLGPRYPTYREGLKAGLDRPA